MTESIDQRLFAVGEGGTDGSGVRVYPQVGLTWSTGWVGGLGRGGGAVFGLAGGGATAGTAEQAFPRSGVAKNRCVPCLSRTYCVGCSGQLYFLWVDTSLVRGLGGAMIGNTRSNGNVESPVPHRERSEQSRSPKTSTEQPLELTTTQAAEFLDVSRLVLLKLLRRRELPSRMVGNRHRIPLVALENYRLKMFQKARDAADEMTRLAQEERLYELDGPPSTAQ